jgi:hypothetical protein
MAPHLQRVAKWPPAKWFGGLVTVVIAGVLVGVFTNHPPAAAPVAGHVTMRAMFIPAMYSENANGFQALLAGDAMITSEMKSARNCEGLHSVIADSGGVDADGSYVRLSFQNGTRYPALISEVSAQVLPERSDPLTTEIICTLGAGPLDALPGLIQLDAPSPVLLSVKKRAGDPYASDPAGPYFQTHVVSLSPGESFVLDIYAKTGTCTCTWRLAADLMVNGRQVTVVAGDGAQPFRTAPRAAFQVSHCWALDLTATPALLAPSSICG